MGGTSVGDWQIALAKALGCERVLCLAPELDRQALAFQHEVERQGLRFALLRDSRALAGQFTASDAAVVIADGLFAPPDLASAALQAGPAVLVQPVEAGLAAGFERIDLERASAGLVLMPGALVDRIGELPEHCDVFSGLQRIALQAGVEARALPDAEGRDAEIWRVIRSEADAAALEPVWVRQVTREEGALGPARWTGHRIVGRFGPALVEAGGGAILERVGAGLLAMLALVSGGFGVPVLGMALVALAWLVHETGALVSRLALSPRPRFSAWGWVLDAAIVLIAAAADGLMPLQAQPARLFAPAMLVAMIRILGAVVPRRWQGWIEDRAVLALGLGASLLLGGRVGVIELLASIAAIGAVVLVRSRLT